MQSSEAYEAIKAANPGWSPIHIKFCVQMMPTPIGYAYKGAQKIAAELDYKERYDAWRVEMGLLLPSEAYKRPLSAAPVVRAPAPVAKPVVEFGSDRGPKKKMPWEK